MLANMEAQLISVMEAERILMDNLLPIFTYKEELLKCRGKLLKEPIYADRDFPPFDRVTMDGYAISYNDYKKGIRRFRIAGIQPAGTVRTDLHASQECIEVMTGALIPRNADTVIPYEKCVVKDEYLIIETDVVQGQHVHWKGSDHRKGERLLSPCIRITPAEVGVLATIGKSKVEIVRPPKIAIVSTGDELVEIDHVPEPHQIRKSNSHTILSALHQHGLSGDLFHLSDEKEEIFRDLNNILSQNEVVILSGGVSKGKRDFIPMVLEELGINKIFHRIAQRPGKPFFFGKTENVTVFGFPGNPVSAFLCFYRYFLPWYYKSVCSSEDNKEFAILGQDVVFEPNLTYFLQVNLKVTDDGTIMATPSPGNGSGDLMNLTRADGFLELPAHKISFKKGSSYPLFRYRI